VHTQRRSILLLILLLYSCTFRSLCVKSSSWDVLPSLSHPFEVASPVLWGLWRCDWYYGPDIEENLGPWMMHAVVVAHNPVLRGKLAPISATPLIFCRTFGRVTSLLGTCRCAVLVNDPVAVLLLSTYIRTHYTSDTYRCALHAVMCIQMCTIYLECPESLYGLGN